MKKYLLYLIAIAAFVSSSIAANDLLVNKLVAQASDELVPQYDALIADYTHFKKAKTQLMLSARLTSNTPLSAQAFTAVQAYHHQVTDYVKRQEYFLSQIERCIPGQWVIDYLHNCAPALLRTVEPALVDADAAEHACYLDQLQHIQPRLCHAGLTLVHPSCESSAAIDNYQQNELEKRLQLISLLQQTSLNDALNKRAQQASELLKRAHAFHVKFDEQVYRLTGIQAKKIVNPEPMDQWLSESTKSGHTVLSILMNEYSELSHDDYDMLLETQPVHTGIINYIFMLLDQQVKGFMDLEDYLKINNTPLSDAQKEYFSTYKRALAQWDTIVATTPKTTTPEALAIFSKGAAAVLEATQTLNKKCILPRIAESVLIAKKTMESQISKAERGLTICKNDIQLTNSLKDIALGALKHAALKESAQGQLAPHLIEVKSLIQSIIRALVTMSVCSEKAVRDIEKFLIDAKKTTTFSEHAILNGKNLPHLDTHNSTMVNHKGVFNVHIASLLNLYRKYAQQTDLSFASAVHSALNQQTIHYSGYAMWSAAINLLPNFMNLLAVISKQ